MSANHDIKSQPPAGHFTTILCTKSQQSRFVALPRQLPHLKKFKSLSERGRGKSLQLRISTQILWFIAATEAVQFSELASFYSVTHFTVGQHLAKVTEEEVQHRKFHFGAATTNPPLQGSGPPTHLPLAAPNHSPPGIFKVTMPLQFEAVQPWGESLS